MVTKFYQYVQLTKTKAVTDADVMKLTEDDYVVCSKGDLDPCKGDLDPCMERTQDGKTPVNSHC